MFPQRSHYAGTLNASHVGSRVTLNGWVATRRDLGGLIFVDVRDHTGIAQAVFSPQHAPQLMDRASELRNEFVVSLTGEVRHRERPNPGIATGAIEVYVDELEILNRAEPTPFEVGNRAAASEELRLKYRYLDLRDQSLQRILRMRSQVYGITRQYFAGNGFVEVETPIMVRATPEGARDYLVPSRVHPGHFYALPQSPQIYKQLLMVGGFDRYFQIARCMRDEDLRADRQPEFTQIDLEMAFVRQEDVLSIVEGYFAAVWREIRGVELELPLPRMPYREAMERYGSDKPDTRFGMELVNVGDLLSATEFSVFRGALDSGGAVVGLLFSGGAHYSRKQIDELTEHVKRYRAKGLVWLKAVAGDELEGGSAKFLSPDERRALRTRLGAVDGDLLLLVADGWHTAHTALGQLRLELARRENLIPKDRDALLFIVDFPMFEPELHPETGQPIPAHHPFTSVKPEDAHLLATDPLKARANCYDPVINGYEIGSGSIRIHDRETQREIFQLIGLSEEEARRKFGFLLDAFRYGAPPHGGVALGLDRIIMILAGTENIRDVIAYPKTASAASLMDEAPSPADAGALEALRIRVVAASGEE